MYRMLIPAIEALTEYYATNIKPGSDILDICSSWISHYPKVNLSIFWARFVRFRVHHISRPPFWRGYADGVVIAVVVVVVVVIMMTTAMRRHDLTGMAWAAGRTDRTLPRQWASVRDSE